MPVRRSRVLWLAKYTAFRRQLVAARHLADLTQREAAHRLGKSQTFVAKCETGDRRVDVVELMEFARVYRRPLAFFVEPIG